MRCRQLKPLQEEIDRLRSAYEQAFKKAQLSNLNDDYIRAIDGTDRSCRRPKKSRRARKTLQGRRSVAGSSGCSARK